MPEKIFSTGGRSYEGKKGLGMEGDWCTLYSSYCGGESVLRNDPCPAEKRWAI